LSVESNFTIQKPLLSRAISTTRIAESRFSGIGGNDYFDAGSSLTDLN